MVKKGLIQKAKSVKKKNNKRLNVKIHPDMKNVWLEACVYVTRKNKKNNYIESEVSN